MPGVPFRAWPAHVMPLGAVGVAGALDQAVAVRHDRIKAAKQQHDILSVRFAEHEGERQNEEFVVEIVADMHDPVAPVFRVASHDQRPDEAGRSVARLGEIAHRFAGSIDSDVPGIQAVEINLGHAGLLRSKRARSYWYEVCRRRFYASVIHLTVDR